MTRERISFLFINIGHFFDHLILLVFATVAALVLVHEWGLSYSELIPYATPGLIAFGVGALPAGWIADKWSREAMMVVFFIGLGVAAAATAFAETPLQIGVGLFLIGLFAAIYHPVGLAMVVEGRRRTGVPLAVNGVFGNMGVACAALLTGWLIDVAGWRAAFAEPGAVCITVGRAYAIFGSGDIDLRGAATAEEGATIRIIALFGSVDLLVPADWDVNTQTWAVFGDVASKRGAPTSPVGRLTLTGLCLFGGVEVKS